MTFHHGWLMIGEGNGNYAELFNHARTAAYLTNSTVLGCGTIHNVLDDGGCAGYPWMPGVDPAELLREAVLWLDAEHSEVGEQAAVNYGSGGAALNARYGSTAGSDTNDPLLLTHTGENYVYFPGTLSNYLSVPDEAALDITGDIEIVARIQPNDWSPALRNMIVSKWEGTASYRLAINDATNGFVFSWSVDGVAAREIGVGDFITNLYPNGEARWIKFTFDADNGAGGVTAQLYVQPDGPTEPASWGTAVDQTTLATASSIFASTSPLAIGTINATGSQYFEGNIYRTIIRNGIGGTTVFDFNAATDITDAGATSFTATSGQTVTVNRATSGRKTALVTRPIWLFGTDDYLEVADNALLDFGAEEDFTALAVYRQHETLASFVVPLAKRSSTSAAAVGWHLFQATAPASNPRVSDGVTAVAATGGSVVASELAVHGVTRDCTANTLTAFKDATLGTPVADGSGSLSNSEAVRVGRFSGAGGGYLDAELVAVAVWRRVLTADEIAVITAYCSQEAYDDRVVGIPAFAQATFSTPSGDEAPWYNSSYPESGEALGFWITEWTGLDSGHIQREVTQVGAYRGGGVMGALGSRSRDMGFEIILLGESEKALDYLFRWLDATLSSVCATCATDTILLRRYCPDAIDPADPDTITDGVVEMRGVGLISGLQWGAPPVEQAGCFIRRANFTLGATDPCMYGLCTDVPISQSMVWADCWAAAALSESRVECRPNCSEMDPTCRATFNFTVDAPSGMSPILRFVAPTDTVGSVPFRVRTYANPNGLLAGELCGAPLLAELYIAEMPPYSELTYDMATREVLFSNAATGAPINGFAYILPNTVGVPRFATLGCGDYTVVVEPADFCYPSAPNVIRKYSEVSMVIRERMGCA